MLTKDKHILAVCLALACHAHVMGGGPTIGPWKRLDTGGGASPANETTVSSANRSVVTAWNDGRIGNWRIGYSLSHDGGQSWQEGILLSPEAIATFSQADPFSTADPRTGDFWLGGLSAREDGGLFVAHRPADSEAFEPPVVVISASFVDKPWMAAGPIPGLANTTRLYIAFNMGVVHSDDLGQTWNVPNFLDSGISFLPRVDANGVLYIAYRRFEDNNFWLAVSEDGGDSYDLRLLAERMNIGQFVPGEYRVSEYCAIAIDSDRGIVYALYSDVTEVIGTEGHRDLFITKSSNKGISWSVPTIVSDSDFSPGDQFLPWLEVDNAGRLHLLWYDTRNVDQLDDNEVGFVDAYYAFSEDGGENWSEYRLTPRAFSSAGTFLDGKSQFLGDYLGMSVSDERIIPCYPEARNGDLDIYTRVITYAAVDVDNDGDTDLADFGGWSDCTSFPAMTLSTGELGACNRFDTDVDGDVDLIDFARLQNTFSGDCGIIIVDSPENLTLCPGDSGIFAIAADVEPIQTQWERDGIALDMENATQLELPEVTFDDAGMYRAVVFGQCGSAKSNRVQLIVRQPTIIDEPQSVIVCPQATVSFSVESDGYPPLSYQWLRNGEILNEQTKPVLTIDDVVPADQAEYNCIVTDGCGTSVESASASLSVTQLQIFAHPLSMNYCIGSDITLFVSASGGSTAFQWFKDDQPIAGATDFFLHIANADKSHTGSYNVVISNECESLESEIAEVDVSDCR